MKRLLALGLIFFSLLFILENSSAQDQRSVLVIPIKGTIDLGLASFCERVIKEAETSKASAVILEINTPGGRVDAANRISDAVCATALLTIAFINNEAISAGALIALSARRIVMAPRSTFGDAEPQPTSEKTVSYIRAKMRAAAEKNGRSPDIAAAMVDKDLVIKGIKEKGKLLTLTTEEALRLKFIDHKASSLEEVLSLYKLKEARVKIASPNWAEEITRFITHPIVAALLLTLGFLGLLFELQTPGWGIGGTISLIFLGLFFFGHMLVGLAGLETLLLFMTGITLLLIEILLIPGFGLTGIAGIAAIIISAILALVGRRPFLPDLVQGVKSLSLAIMLTFVLALVSLKFFPKTSLWKRMILSTEERRELGYQASILEASSLLGKSGVTSTPLRPAGSAIIDNKRYDVVSEGGFIEINRRVKVVRVEGNRIVVREE